MASAADLERASGLLRSAREDKRESQRRRRAALRTMEQLRRFCAERGIPFEIVTESEEDRVNGRAESTE
jgi:hypothetical protein